MAGKLVAAAAVGQGTTSIVTGKVTYEGHKAIYKGTVMAKDEVQKAKSDVIEV